MAQGVRCGSRTSLLDVVRRTRVGGLTLFFLLFLARMCVVCRFEVDMKAQLLGEMQPIHRCVYVALSLPFRSLVGTDRRRFF